MVSIDPETKHQQYIKDLAIQASSFREGQDRKLFEKELHQNSKPQVKALDFSVLGLGAVISKKERTLGTQGRGHREASSHPLSSKTSPKLLGLIQQGVRV